MKNNLKLTEISEREMDRIVGGKSNKPSCGCWCDSVNLTHEQGGGALDAVSPGL